MARVESWEVEPWEIVGLPCAPEAVPPIHAIRGTMVLSSVQAMRARGLTDAYFERLPRTTTGSGACWPRRGCRSRSPMRTTP